MTTTLNGFGPLLALMPHEFGFCPQGSLVLVSMRGNQVCAMVRLDEACIDVPGTDAEVLLGENVSPAISRFDADVLVSVAYQCSPQTAGLEVFNRWLERTFVPVDHSFVVSGDVWWTTLCRWGCCDDELHDLTECDSQGLAQAAGLVQEPKVSRQAALATLAVHDHEQARRVFLASMALGSVAVPHALHVWDRMVSGGDPSIEDIATVVASLREPYLRDCFLSFIVPELADLSLFQGIFPGGHERECARQTADGAAANLLRNLPQVPREARSHWLTLLALSRWRGGYQCGAQLAAEAALGERPLAPLAKIAATALSLGMPYPHDSRVINR